MLQKLNIHQNKKLHRSVSHFSASIIALAAATGAAGALDPHQLAMAMVEPEPDLISSQARETEVGHLPINLGGVMRSAHSSGKR